MRFIILSSLFIALGSNACLNLSGHQAGNCVYKSPSFGELNGSIEFNIQQPSCDQITLDGSTLSIPGQFEAISREENVIDYTKLAMSWKDSAQQVLNFDYIRTVDEKGQRVDDVSLTGYFKKSGPRIILQQQGLVDRDPVEIYCELQKLD